MARLVGVDLPRDKRIEVALTYIFGIGKTRAHAALDATGVSPDMRVHQLGDEELVKLRDYIEANFQVEGDLRREVTADIRRKVEIGSYQGRRHRQGLPGPWSAHQDQRAYPQGTQAHRRRQEEGRQVTTGRLPRSLPSTTHQLPRTQEF